MKSIELGNVAGLRLTAHPTALIGFVGLWIGLSLITIGLFNLPVVEGIFWAFLATFLHFFSEFFHQWGHARAARRVGYPMIGVRFWWILGASIYPKDEPPLPGKTHIRRALGGPYLSFLLTLVAALLCLVLIMIIPTDTPALFEWKLLVLSLFVFLDNLLVFTLGAFLPLGFTDGSTFLRWRGK
jgi:hypothetical protein